MGGGGSGKRIPPPPLEASLDDSQQSTSLTQSKLKPTIIDQSINPRKRYQSVLFIYWERYIYIYIYIIAYSLFDLFCSLLFPATIISILTDIHIKFKNFNVH